MSQVQARGLGRRPGRRLGSTLMGEVLLGTSGYSYDDWKGPFYPPRTAARGYLAYYSRFFPACEINFTYYRPPSAAVFERMLEKSGGRVVFTVKAHGEMTHERTAGESAYRDFLEALRPLREAARLGCVLAQFPYSFRRSREGWSTLDAISRRFEAVPLVVEFRHRSWVARQVFDALRRRGIGICCVDEPRLPGLVPPFAEVTGPVGYVRFHGRNKSAWFEHENPAERYDYLYSDEELHEWVPRIREMAGLAERTFVFANNHFGAKAVVTARRLMEMLGIAAPVPGERQPGQGRLFD